MIERRLVVRRLVVLLVTGAAMFVLFAAQSLAVSKEANTFKVESPPEELKAKE